MEQAWGPRKSTRAQGESAPGGSSKLVQLQRQSSATGPALATLMNSSGSVLSQTSTLSTLSNNGPMISGGALDFGSRADALNTSISSKSGTPGSSGLSSVGGGISGTGITGPGAGSSIAGSTNIISSGQTVHPLHFNWVFWFMHRTPGSKILNYESSMKKIATFGSVEDFWAVYSHLKRPHDLPNVSDYHLFKQGVRPVWEDATNINGGKWIVRLKKGLASRYWENLVMAVIGDQFDVGSEICGIVLSIRGGEDILSLWNQSAHEGRINLKIRYIIYGYTDDRVPSPKALYQSQHTMTSTTRDLLPPVISFFLSNKSGNNNSSNGDSNDVRAHLNRIPRSTWLRMGSECHNASFASEIAAVTVPKPSPSASLAAAKAAEIGPPLTLDNGLPKIIQTIQRQRQIRESSGTTSDVDPQEHDLLWDLFFICRDHFRSEGIRSSNNGRKNTEQSLPWQLQFLKAACPEVTVFASMDMFLQYGPKHGFADRDLPTNLMQVLDYDWRSSSVPARRAVLALIQTMIVSRRFIKTSISGGNETSITGIHKPMSGLGIGYDAGSTEEKSAAISEAEEGDFDRDCRQLASTLTEMCAALEIFFETESGRSLPKLRALYHQEVLADIKAHSKPGHGVKRAGVDGGMAGLDPSDPLSTHKRHKGSSRNEKTSDSPTPSMDITATTTGIVLQDQTLRISSQLVELAQKNTHGAPSAFTMTVDQQQAKLSNPLWSPILQQNYMPHLPGSYRAQALTESERWLSVLTHMDGTVFSERLVELFRAFYPSDQKFLFDQTWIEFMCWEGAGGRERGTEDELVYAADAFERAKLYTIHGMRAQRGIKAGEFVMDAIMGALVSMVIKPEESSTYLEPGTKKWTEPIQDKIQESTNKHSPAGIKTATVGHPGGPSRPPTTGASTQFSGFSSAALGGTKKRKGLYNRRMSPFYATLYMFQPHRIVDRVRGVLYLDPEDVVESTTSQDAEPPLKPAETAVNLSRKDVRAGKKNANPRHDGSRPHNKYIINGVNVADPAIQKIIYSRLTKGPILRPQDKQATATRTAAAIVIDQQGVKIQIALQKVKEGKSLVVEDYRVVMLKTKYGLNDLPKSKRSPPEVIPAEHDIRMDVDVDPLPPPPEPEAEAQPIASEESETHTTGGTESVEIEEQRSKETNVDSRVWMGETALDQEVQLAQQAEASRNVCNAPFRVLMFILQYLTRSNQSGMLDAWIGDALSGTAYSLRIHYFEWALLTMLVPSPISKVVSPAAPTGAKYGMNGESETPLKDEILRLLEVLISHTGIGHEPIKTAFTNVLNAYMLSVPQAPIPDDPYWASVKRLLEKH
ncbi:Eukaryotic translation initiation factor 4E type 2 [Haplosporangium sp. Z 767]|nr:Eukaryotic translation initiation factor 4E type 2 [Haplosporangium sp. Z 767]